MRSLDLVLNVLESQPSEIRSRFALRRNGHSATIHRGAMQAYVSELEDGVVEVAYEHALHEITRERLSPEQAARLLLAVIRRETLVRVELPEG